LPTAFLPRIAAGDPLAVAACIDEYGGTIWGLAERYLKGFGDDLEDAVQEVFVEIWRHANRFDPLQGSEAAFIATIAHRRLIDRQRRAQTRRAVHFEDHGFLASKPLAFNSAELADDVRKATEAFQKLDADEKQVLWFSLYHGLSHERIATTVNIPLGTVKTRLRRGLMRLRELLQADFAPSNTRPKVEGAAQ